MVVTAGMTCRALTLVLLTWMLVLAVTPSRLADRVVDHVHYGLLRDDWLRLRERDH